MTYSRLALCDDDRCAFKHAAPIHDPEAADHAAHRHLIATGHTSTFYPGRGAADASASAKDHGEDA